MGLNSTLKKKLFKGKNNKLAYYLKSGLRIYLLPNAIYRIRRENILKQLEKRPDKKYIQERVDYYCKLLNSYTLSADAQSIAEFKLKGHKSVYFFDSYEYIRYFPIHYKWKYVFGDNRAIQDEPSIVKSRVLADDNITCVLLNMDKVRHFTFVSDTCSFKDKLDKVIFRGEICDKERRINFFNKWYNDPDCDLGEVGRIYNANWRKPKIGLYEHLQYKYIMALEGNDVASNLKWVMSSNSLAVMPRPTCETWFMEGQLIPNYHYVEIKPDYSDLKEKLAYYSKNVDKAEAIIHNAHQWVDQFRDKKREKLISLLVFDKYFKMINQY